MPTMETEPGTTKLSVIAISWLAASAALPFALVGAACGQGVGALTGGCHWIGVTLPLDRQVWALVNQPVLNFASLPGAGGYWLGSILVPLAVAAAIIGFLPRARSLVTELVVVQIAWAMSTVAVAWLPLLDADDGHLIRFLTLHGWPGGWVWLAPVLAAGAALLPTLRLLSLARRRRPNIGRASRVLVVAVHLFVPAVAWIGLASLIRGAVPVLPSIAMAAPLASAVAFAWFRYPAPFVHPLESPRPAEIVVLTVAATILSAGVWLAGRPLTDGRSAGFLWGRAQSFNNIRQWIEPRSLTGNESDIPNG